MAMEIERRREMADRLRELRGPKPQPAIANAIGVGLRTYQTWEEAAVSPSWENLQALAGHFNVSEDYLLYGEAETQGPKSQLDRVEGKLDEVLSLLRLRVQEAAEDEEEQRALQSERTAPRRATGTPGRRRSTRPGPPRV